MRTKLIVCLVLGALLLHLVPAAANVRRDASLERAFVTCSRLYGIPVLLLKAIARQESDFEPLLLNIAGKDIRPKDMAHARALLQEAEAAQLSYDVGLLQINRWWIKKWKVAPWALLDPEINIMCGGRILAGEIARDGFTWRAIGHYHSHTPWRAEDYARKIRGHVRWLLRASAPVEK